MNLNDHNIMAVLMHGDVGRAMNGKGSTPAIALLVRARKSRRDWVRAQANAKEEAATVPSRGGYVAGYSGLLYQTTEERDAREKQIVAGVLRRFQEALSSDGLPADLRDLIVSAIAKAEGRE